jgi:hypothetical protein
MTNWLVTLVNTLHPFDKKKELVHAETVIEALDEFNHKQQGYTAVSASFFSSNTDIPSDLQYQEI